MYKVKDNHPKLKMNNKCFGRSCFRPWRLPVELYGSKSENLWGVCTDYSQLSDLETLKLVSL